MKVSVGWVYRWLLLFGVGVVIHNLVSGWLGVEEGVFFLVAMGCLVAFGVSVVLVAWRYWRKREPKDIWKLWGVGLLGLLGFWMPLLAWLLPFLGFLVLRKWKDKDRERLVKGVLFGLVFLLVWAALDDVTTGNEPRLWGEWLMVVGGSVAMLWLGAELVKKR